MSRSEEICAYFRRSGLPLLDEDFSARSGVFNRAAPLLAIVFILEILNAVDLSWSLTANIAALAAGLSLFLGAIAATNKLRGRRALVIPDDVGPIELSVFVLVPALLPLVVNAQPVSAIVTLAVNSLILLISYAIWGYGVISIIGWMLKRMWRQILSSLSLMVRAVPLLMVLVLLSFANTEIWQIFSTVPPVNIAAIEIFFVSMGAAFILIRLPREIDSLEESEVEQKPLSARQRRNVGAVMFIGQSLQIFAVSALIWMLFVVFGLIGVTEPVREIWIGKSGDVILSLTVLGSEIELTRELLLVSLGLATFTGLYFAIAMLTDPDYREEFFSELTGELRDVFNARREYLLLREERQSSD